jgi:di/tricarboxylate transporter
MLGDGMIDCVYTCVCVCVCVLLPLPLFQPFSLISSPYSSVLLSSGGWYD